MAQHTDDPMSSPERLAYWYLRLNGFLLLENFLVHPEIGTMQRTDADLIGLRFLHRRENALLPMEDDPLVCQCSQLLNVVIAEVKTSGAGRLNAPWRESDRENIQRVLRAIGCIPEAHIEPAAADLYPRGRFESDQCLIRLLTFSETRNRQLPDGVVQVIWDHALTFMHGRFKVYRNQKSSDPQWPADGKALRRAAIAHADTSDFIIEARLLFGLRPPNSPSTDARDPGMARLD